MSDHQFTAQIATGKKVQAWISHKTGFSRIEQFIQKDFQRIVISSQRQQVPVKHPQRASIAFRFFKQVKNKNKKTKIILGTQMGT